MSSDVFGLQQATPLYGAHGFYQAPLNLAIKSHSDLELGKEVNVRLSLQLRPSMFQNVSVKVSIQCFQPQTNIGLVFPAPIQQLSVATGSCLTHSVTQFDEMTVSFIPVVSGEHQISVTSQGQTEAVKVSIHGKPKVGAAVKQGPHWSHQEYNISGGGYFGYTRIKRYVHGTVSNTAIPEGYISVLWDGHTRPEQHLWGHNGQYGVQLDL